MQKTLTPIFATSSYSYFLSGQMVKIVISLFETDTPLLPPIKWFKIQPCQETKWPVTRDEEIVLQLSNSNYDLSMLLSYLKIGQHVNI